MHSITDWLSRASGPAVYAVVGALVFCEDALFFGFVLPGETAAVLGGVVANEGRISVYWLCAVVVLAAVAGDSVGYEVGRRFGPRILHTRALSGHTERIDHARELIRKRGPAAVFLGRFIAFFRALMPALAGMSRMPYRVFLAFNAAGGLVWGIGFCLLGYYAGDAYKRVEHTAGTAVAIVVAVAVVAALVYWHFRRRHQEAAQEQQPGATGDRGDTSAGDPGDPGEPGDLDGPDAPEATDGPGSPDGADAPEATDDPGHGESPGR